ncbi:MAG: hypothetical protein QOD48_1258 [Gaiellaceae bacterium]|jgi:hypothetical protein|nr:hypothetical protein [Gaiellaceae bacterium]
MKLKLVLPVLALAAAGAAFWPAAGGAATFKGIVVAKQHGTLLVTSPSGAVHAVSGRAAVGSRVAVSGRTVTVVGRAHTALVRGIVVRRIGTTMFLSSNRHLLAIHNARRLAGTATSTTAPQPGAVVEAQVSVDNGDLVEQDEQEVGQANSSSIQVQATVSAVGVGTVTLNVQGQTLTVNLPGGLTLPASLVGQTVTISLSLDDNQGDNQNGDSSDDSGGGGDD